MITGGSDASKMDKPEDDWFGLSCSTQFRRLSPNLERVIAPACAGSLFSQTFLWKNVEVGTLSLPIGALPERCY